MRVQRDSEREQRSEAAVAGGREKRNAPSLAVSGSMRSAPTGLPSVVRSNVWPAQAMPVAADHEEHFRRAFGEKRRGLSREFSPPATMTVEPRRSWPFSASGRSSPERVRRDEHGQIAVS